MTTEFIVCPEPDCLHPSTVEDRGYANGDPMPVRIVKTRCVDGHWFMGAADTLGAQL